MNILDYDTERRVFLAPISANSFNTSTGQARFFKPCTKYDTYCMELEDVYPKNIIGIRNLKDRWKGLGISKEAIKRIYEIKNYENNLKTSNALYEKHKDLFKREPYKHQIEAINNIYTRDRLMLVLEQGLGKTYIAYMSLAIMKSEGIPYKTLIICPKIVLPTWLREVKEYTDLNIIDYCGNPKKRKLTEDTLRIGNLEVVVTTFDMMIIPSVVKFIKECKFDNVIVDEASRCINVQAKRSKAIQDVAADAKRVYLMSGTLCLGRPTDIYMPANILDPSIINMNVWKFKNRYCNVSPYNKHIITGYKHIDELKELTDPFILAKKRSDCIDLPDRVIERQYYELTDKQIEMYNAIVDKDLIELEDDNVIHTELTIQKINKLLQCVSGFVNVVNKNDYVCYKCKNIRYCVLNNIQQGSARCTNKEASKIEQQVIELGSNKLEMLLEDIQSAGDKKVIVWAWFRHDLEAIKTKLTENNINFITPEDKDCDKRFNEDNSIQVFLGQTKQGIGITLNAAHIMIYYGHGADLEARLQSMDRNYRIGQSEKVVVYDYVCANTIEDNLLCLLEHKNMVKEVMQSTQRCSFCTKMQECLESGKLEKASSCRKYDGTKIAEVKETLKVRFLEE